MSATVGQSPSQASPYLSPVLGASFSGAAQLVDVCRPEHPVLCVRPHAARRAAAWFETHFPGRVLYAVKTNPLPVLLQAIADGGVRDFDVASLAEVRLIHERFPGAGMAFVHPVKSPAVITRAYHDYGVRTFALDTREELLKIVSSTGGAKDLQLLVRMATPAEHGALHLSSKFGASPVRSVGLLQEARRYAERVGLTFHVGSQTLNPGAWTHALQAVSGVIRRSGVIVDVVDVGGGFPVRYPGMEPPPLQDFVDVIEEGFDALPVAPDTELWCEPGRALAAEACSLVVRVEQRRGQQLYLNDGTYGSLFDAGRLGFVYPARLLRPGAPPSDAELRSFSLFGPTCDSLDFMPGPFELPDDIRTGDWIELGTLGAYSVALRTAFHGLELGGVASVEDAPMTTVYGPSERPAEFLLAHGRAARPDAG